MGIIDPIYAVVKPMARSVPVVSLSNESDPGDLRKTMRRLLDHPVVKHLPFLAVLVPALACALLWAITHSPGLAIGGALVLYAQMSSLSSKHVVASLWATTTLAIRQALANGEMSKDDPGDQALVAQTARAFTVYGFAMTLVVPVLNAMVAAAVLAVTAMSEAGGTVLPTLLTVLMATIAFSAVLVLIPNRIFVKHVTTILSKSRKGR